MITIVYFARLREAFGKESERMALPAGVSDIAALRAFLRTRGGAWAEELGESRPVRAAVNYELAAGDSAVSDGDEIAFFPPVTGG